MSYHLASWQRARWQRLHARTSDCWPMSRAVTHTAAEISSTTSSAVVKVPARVAMMTTCRRTITPLQDMRTGGHMERLCRHEPSRLRKLR